MQQRLDWLDLWRSLSVCAMIAYHLLWDMERCALAPAGVSTAPVALGLRWLCAGSFIFLSGVCLPRSRDPLRRAFTLLCCAAAVQLVSALAGAQIRFGVLHLLAVCMLLFGALQKRALLPQRPIWAWASLLAFALSAWALPRTVVSVRWLYPLGLRTAAFSSGDYYPLLPWAFLFLTGVLASPRVTGNARLAALRLPRWLTFAGRHSLAIYLLHQPILLALLRLLQP